jgi:hypothetical protein
VSNPTRKSHSAWNWILVLPLFGLLFPGLYARQTPEILGFPFFYWYQVAWVLVTGVLTGIVYLATERKNSK